MRLSLLICHLGSRKLELERLRAIIDPTLTDEVEVLVETDRGILTTGEKRNRLLARAMGDYVAFIDDDDTVSPEYVPATLAALARTPEATHCELWGLYTPPRASEGIPFHLSMRYATWRNTPELLERPVDHLNAVRRDIALHARFPALDVGEDVVYATGIAPLLRIEAPLPGLLYGYDHSERRDYQWP
jgi:hypothetical protein